MMVDRELTRLLQEHPDIEVEKIDIVTNPRRTVRSGIRMIPALKAGDRTLSGIFLTRRQLKDFLSLMREEAPEKDSGNQA